MQPVQNLSINHSLVDYTYLDSDPWSRREIELFTSAFLNHGKNFQNIANHVSWEIATDVIGLTHFFYTTWRHYTENVYKFRINFLRIASKNHFRVLFIASTDNITL